VAEPARGVPEDHYFTEPPSVLERNISAGVRLLAGALISFYGAFLFCYVYLRERDSASAWRPSGVTPPLGTGIAILACVAASVALTVLAVALLHRLGEHGWRRAALLSQVAATAALGVQCYQWAVLGFAPGDGAYASVFIAWTGFFAGFGLPCGLYWRQTTLSTSFRHRHREAAGVVAVAGMPGGEGASRARLATEARALAFFWYCLGAVELVSFVLLYLVK
jgi:heme/copper-type cytochrome/quinol oxidase subunit 3